MVHLKRCYKIIWVKKMWGPSKPRCRSLICAAILHMICYTQYGFTVSIVPHIEGPENNSAWFTGPLLAPAAGVVPLGHFNIQPYYFHTVVNGAYDKNWNTQSLSNFHNNTLLVVVQGPVIKNIGFIINPQILWNTAHGHSGFGFGDLPVALAFQLRPPAINSWKPSIKLAIGTSIPFGKFQGLDPNQYNTDACGWGSWFPTISCVTSYRIHMGQSIHFLNIRIATSYSIGTRTRIKGINSYGGDIATRGWVYPGNAFKIDTSLEFNLSQNWAVAMDTLYSHNNKTRFSGKTTDSMTSPSSEQFSLAPALEYNFNNNIGLIGGVWFTIAGRNSAQFTSGALSLNVYY